MSRIVLIDLDGTLIPGNAPDKECGPRYTPFDAEKTCVTRESFQQSIDGVLAAGARVGPCYIVTAANDEWVKLIQKCYARLGHVISVAKGSGSAKEWKVAEFTRLIKKHDATEIVVIGDSLDSEIAAGRKCANDHNVRVHELHLRSPGSNCEAVQRNHAEIIAFLQPLSR